MVNKSQNVLSIWTDSIDFPKTCSSTRWWKRQEEVRTRRTSSTCSGLEIDEQRLLRNGSFVHLAPKEFETLRLLVEHHGRLVSKRMLLDHVWTGTFVGDDAITQRICVLRKALGEPEGARFIETVPKCGYRFVAPVRALKR